MSCNDRSVKCDLAVGNVRSSFGNSRWIKVFYDRIDGDKLEQWQKKKRKSAEVIYSFGSVIARHQADEANFDIHLKFCSVWQCNLKQ